MTTAVSMQPSIAPASSSPTPDLPTGHGGAAQCGTRLWGLSAAQLHDAFWRSHGILCVRRGQAVAGTPADGIGAATPSGRAGADAFLLLEPEQLVLFDLREIAASLQWTRAELCRLRVDEAGEESYRERVRVGEDGLVKRIERVYSREYRVGHSVLLTDRASVAQSWARAPSRRDGWKALRRGGRAVQSDAYRVHGWSYRNGDAAHEALLLNRLVDHWPDPERSIEGIEALGVGIYGVKGTTVPTEDTLVGPLWLGGGYGSRTSAPHREHPSGRLLVGPSWEPDRSAVEGVRLLDIDEILSPERVSERERSRGSERSAYLLVKRLIDIAVSSAVLLAILPILLVVAVAVVLDDGLPIFFGHRRQTKGGRVFHCWKFRTMRRNAEALAKELRSLNVCDGPQFFIKDDPRVTRVGKVLRAWHLDELPQFWNVLVGDMSMVGPRPSPDGENQFCPAWRELRLSVRPGITGLWQVERTREPGRDFQEWIRYDIEYVNRASLWLDLWICFKTISNIVHRRGSGQDANETSGVNLASSSASERGGRNGMASGDAADESSSVASPRSHPHTGEFAGLEQHTKD